MSEKAPKLISDRNLDEKTIRKAEDGTHIEVAIEESNDNMLEVTENGLKVKKPQTVELLSLGGTSLGELIIKEEN